MVQFFRATNFEWDHANSAKNLNKHNVGDQECEEVFFDPFKKIFRDELHSADESRFILIGKTKKGRLLFVVFTFRKRQVRVISARDLNRKEYPLYQTTV